jgi:hypothetical protein
VHGHDIKKLRKLKKEDKKMQLTFTDPPFSGYVLEVTCIRPDPQITYQTKVADSKSISRNCAIVLIQLLSHPLRPTWRRCSLPNKRWRDLVPPLLEQAAELFRDGKTVKEVAAVLGLSKSEAGRLRLRSVQRFNASDS